MPEIARFNGCRDWINLDIVERQRTSECEMMLGIPLQLARLLLSNIVSIFGELGVERTRKTIHDCIQKADLQPTEVRSPNHYFVNLNVIRIVDPQFWLYAGANSETTDLLHLYLLSTTTTVLTEIFLQELRQKHHVKSAVFLADGAQHP